MFFKPANFYTENDITKNSKMSPEKNHVQRKLETGKMKIEMNQNNTVVT